MVNTIRFFFFFFATFKIWLKETMQSPRTKVYIYILIVRIFMSKPSPTNFLSVFRVHDWKLVP